MMDSWLDLVCASGAGEVQQDGDEVVDTGLI